MQQMRILRQTVGFDNAPFSSPLKVQSLMQQTPASHAPQPAATSTAPAVLRETLSLIEATAQSAAQLHAMATHAAALETKMREQQAAAARAEEARREATEASLALTQEVATLRTDKESLNVKLEHYMKRTDELLAERGLGTQQLAELGQSMAAERLRGRFEVGELQAAIAALEEASHGSAAALEQRDAANRALQAQVSRWGGMRVALRWCSSRQRWPRRVLRCSLSAAPALLLTPRGPPALALRLPRCARAE